MRRDSSLSESLDTLLRWRRDVRRFRTDPLDPVLVDALIASADLAPSVGLSQPWRFVLVESEARRAMVRANFEGANAQALKAQPRERAGQYARLKLAGLDAAPCQIAVFCDEASPQGHGLGRATMPETLRYSVVVAVHTLWLAARARGVGLGWVSILEPEAMNAALDVPPDWRFVAYLCLGYPQTEDDTPELEREGWQTRSDPASRTLRR